MELAYGAEMLLGVKDEDVELETAARQYGLSAAELHETVLSLQRWYKMEPHLPSGKLKDRQLIRHLAACGFSVERAKRCIDSYYTARRLTPEFTQARDPCAENIQNVFRIVHIATFPRRTPENHRVSLLRLVNPDVSLWQASDAFKVAFMIGDYRLMNDTVVGEHYIVSFPNIRMGHLAQFTPSLVTKTLYYLQSCIGAKIKGIHLVGLPPYAEAIVNMFKKALSEKVAGRFHTYASFEELKNIFPAKILPKDLGGEDISTEEIMENWKNILQSPTWRQWFIEQENVTTDESKRIDMSTCSIDLLGTHGSFRKLDVD